MVHAAQVKLLSLPPWHRECTAGAAFSFFFSAGRRNSAFGYILHAELGKQFCFLFVATPYYVCLLCAALQDLVNRLFAAALVAGEYVATAAAMVSGVSDVVAIFGFSCLSLSWKRPHHDRLHCCSGHTSLLVTHPHPHRHPHPAAAYQVRQVWPGGIPAVGATARAAWGSLVIPSKK